MHALLENFLLIQFDHIIQVSSLEKGNELLHEKVCSNHHKPCFVFIISFLGVRVRVRVLGIHLFTSTVLSLTSNYTSHIHIYLISSFLMFEGESTASAAVNCCRGSSITWHTLPAHRGRHTAAHWSPRDGDPRHVERLLDSDMFLGSSCVLHTTNYKHLFTNQQHHVMT